MKTFITILSLSISFLCSAQTSSFLWAKAFGGQNEDFGRAIGIDNSGNVITTGTIQKYVGTTVDFDPGPGTFPIAAAEQYDGYVSKLDANGNFLWAKIIGSFVYGNSIAVDNEGNIYIAGAFTGETDFDPGAAVFTMTAPNNFTFYGTNAFILKLDAEGNFLWARNVGSIYDDAAFGIHINGTNIYISGSYNGTVDFDPTDGTSEITNIGVKDAFILNLTTNGDFVWAKSFGSASDDVCNALTTDSEGNIYATGSNGINADLDPGTSTTTISNAGAFVLKLDNAGNFIMAKGFENAIGMDIKTDASGNIYTAGTFQGLVDLDPGTSLLNYQSAGGGNDAFVSKLDASGNLVWAKNIFSQYAEFLTTLKIGSDDNIYLGGTSNYSGLSIFDGPTNVSPGFVGSYLMVLQFNQNGELIGSNYVSGGDCNNSGIVLDEQNNIHSTGSFFNNGDFNPDTAIVNLASNGLTDVYVLKIKIKPFAPNSLNETEQDFSINIFPNPSNGLVNLTTSNLKGHKTIYITDVLGKTVSYSTTHLDNFQILPNLTDKGIYLVTVNSGNKSIRKMLLLE